MKYKMSSTNNKEYSHVQAGWTENTSVRDKELSESSCPQVGVGRGRERARAQDKRIQAPYKRAIHCHSILTWSGFTLYKLTVDILLILVYLFQVLADTYKVTCFIC